MRGSPKVTLDMAMQFWLLRWSGLMQHEIAAKFGVNQGRVSEVLNRNRFIGSETMAKDSA